MTYEAYGIGGTGFVIECLTDNVNRSASDVKAAITKAGGKVGGRRLARAAVGAGTDARRLPRLLPSTTASAHAPCVGAPQPCLSCMPAAFCQVADPGSVLFNFQRQGLVMVAPEEGEDRACEAAMEVPLPYSAGL